MPCPHCEAADDIFNHGYASRKLREYRKDGVTGPTRTLIEALRTAGIDDMTFIDVGGGIGAISLELLKAGAQSGVDVDASHTFLRMAGELAEERGLRDRMTYTYGDFVDIAPSLDPADIVTLDAVICCYPDMQRLVTESAQHANHYLALVYPTDGFISRIGIPLLNLFWRLRGSAFRNFVHPTREVDALIRDHGFEPLHRSSGLLWQTWVYRKAA